MQNRYSFWKLINEYTIKIPIIQRDYAQGRDSDKIRTIRRDFLNTIYEMIEDKEKTIDLDFVYGSEFRENDTQILTPLDGQQRLTTLFLLHWYLALKDKKLNKNIQNILKNFTYETRISSREFCEKLVVSDIELDENESLSSLIEDSSWFFASWKKDSTIQSMLVMLDAIDKKFQKSDDFFEKLIDETNPPITFQFLKLDNFGLTDTLYIKMNARGKSLTEFENFKAKFERYLDEHNKAKMDNSWTDIFWKHRDKESSTVDNKFLNFFQNITLNFYLLNYKREDKEDVTKIDIFNIFEDVYSDETNVKKLIDILDYLASNEESPYFTLFEKFIENSVTHWDRVRFYSLTEALQTDDIENSMRVTKNLINNRLIQTSDDLINALKSIESLYKNSENNIYNYLQSEELKIAFFSSNQVEEEQIKVQLLQESAEWQKAILKYENHRYFDGQISFLLILSDKNIEKFKEYGDKCSQLFDKDILEDDNFIFQRALLSQYNYLPKAGSNYTFCVSDLALRTKMDNWRKVLNNKEKSDSFKELLEDLTLATIGEDLKNIILKSSCIDWRQYFIKDVQFIKYCEKKQIRYYSEDEIYLLKNKQMNGKHLELYSYIFYIKNLKNKVFEPFKTTQYHQSTSWILSSGQLNGFVYRKKEYILDIEFNHLNKTFNIALFTKNETAISLKIVDILKKNGFNSDEKSFVLKGVEENKVLIEIENISLGLKDIL